MATAPHSGGCRCGAVRFCATTDPIWTAYCHCNDCRKATGAPVSAFVGFESRSFECDGALTQYSNGPISRGFCSKCGSPLTYRDERLEGEIYVMIGALDLPDNYAPERHGFTSEKLTWISINDGLPHTSGFTRERPAKGTDI